MTLASEPFAIAQKKPLTVQPIRFEIANLQNREVLYHVLSHHWTLCVSRKAYYLITKLM